MADGDVMDFLNAFIELFLHDDRAFDGVLQCFERRKPDLLVHEFERAIVNLMMRNRRHSFHHRIAGRFTQFRDSVAHEAAECEKCEYPNDDKCEHKLFADGDACPRDEFGTRTRDQFLYCLIRILDEWLVEERLFFEVRREFTVEHLCFDIFRLA